jgi:hypothetical protein
MGAADPSTSGMMILALDGIGQAGGLAMLVAGLAAPKTVLVRQGDLEVRVAPMVAGGRSGLGLVGSF